MKFLARRADTDVETLFVEIFDSYHQRVFHYLYRIIGNRDSAEDLVQEVFLKIYKHLPRYREKRKLSSWVFKIAHTTLMDYFRKTNVQHGLFVEPDEMFILEAQPDKNSYSPEHYLVTKELQEHFEKIIMNLPYKLKEVFLLRHEAGLSFKEISKLLHCPVNRLLGRMHLAIKTIRTDMQEFLDRA